MNQYAVVSQFSHVKPGDTEFTGGGLRDFFLYRDLGIAAATGGQVICEVRYELAPRYYEKSFPDGTRYQEIVAYGSFITVFRTCQYWGPKEECRFCDINENARQMKQSKDFSLSAPVKRVDQVAEVVNEIGREVLELLPKLPIEPMLGTVGVAPAGSEVRSSLVPDRFGGNMDTPQMRAGATVFLGVNVEGAMFSIGDGHYRQGEGEACGTAVEGAMTTTLIVELIKGHAPAWPRIEDDTHWMAIGSSRPMEDSWRIANAELVHWISELYALHVMDAYQLVSQIAQVPVARAAEGRRRAALMAAGAPSTARCRRRRTSAAPPRRRSRQPGRRRSQFAAVPPPAGTRPGCRGSRARRRSRSPRLSSPR